MGEVVYRSHVTVTRHKAHCGPPWCRRTTGPSPFGVHGAVAELHLTDPDTSPPHATTLDYLVAAAAG